MQLSFGKYKGFNVSYLIIKQPNYVIWTLGEKNAQSAFAKIQNEIQKLITVFDKKPFIRKCYGLNCQNKVTRYSAYADNPSSLYFWCESCDPYELGANQGKLVIGKTYRDALDHIYYTCSRTQNNYRAIIRTLALAKGLPARSGTEQLEAFFI